MLLKHYINLGENDSEMRKKNTTFFILLHNINSPKNAPSKFADSQCIEIKIFDLHWFQNEETDVLFSKTGRVAKRASLLPGSLYDFVQVKYIETFKFFCVWSGGRAYFILCT